MVINFIIFGKNQIAMIYTIAALLVIISIVLWRTNGRENYQLLAGLQSLIAVMAFYMMFQGSFDESGYLMFGLFTGFLLLHYLVSRFWKNKNAWIPPIFILISSGLFYLSVGENIAFEDFQVRPHILPIILFPMLGALIVPIADLKEKVLGDFFKIDFKNRRGISRAVYVLLIGLFVFLGHFFGSYIGIGMVVLGFGANLLYNKKSGALWNMYLGLIAIMLIGVFAVAGDKEISNLLTGRVLEGLLFGGFVSLIVNTLGRAKKNQTIATILSLFWILFIPCLLIFLGTQFVRLGGTDAFVGLIVGFAFAAFLGINTRKNSSVLSIYFAIGIVLLPLTVNHEREEMTTITVPTTSGEKTDNNKEIDVFDSHGKELDIDGPREINSPNSQMTFTLGPVGGVTKGAFKSFSGKFDLKAKRIDVKLPISSLTTFVKIRDEELMGADYFNAEKYPEMDFSSTSMEYIGDKYIVKGKFTMMGKTVDKTIEMKYLGKIGKGDAPVFVGKAEVDRTKHGMSSDPTEGDIVSLTFKIELL